MKAELIFMGMKQKKIKMADTKKLSSPPILNIFPQKIPGLVLRSIEWIDGKGSDVAQ